MNKEFFWGALAIVLCVAVEAYFFQGFLLEPNQYLHPFGGDGYYISYHMNFHTRHGEGLWLQSMNHPYGEVIFMTDAQAMLSLALNQLAQWGLPVEPYVVGVMNGFNYYLIPLCALLLYLIFLELKVVPWFALLLALLITLLSPQINRIVIGHYGLGYPFLIPLLIYWTLKARSSGRWYLLSAGICLVLLFFGLNNFYLLLMGGAFCCAAGGLLLLAGTFTGKDKLRLPAVMLMTGLLPMLIGFILVKSLDQVGDRVEVPYGFLQDFELLPSLLYPPNSYIFTTFSESWGLKASASEAAAYIGVIPLLILLGCLIRLVKTRTLSWQFTGHRIFNIVFWVGVVFLLLAMHFPFFGSWKEWGFEIPVLPQFRAQRRFVWGFYYCFTILMGYWGYRFVEYLLRQRSGRILMMVAVLFGTLVWSNDVYHYLKQNTRGIFFTSPYTGEKLQQIKRFAVDNEITKEKYQGIYFLPTMNSWSDKVMQGGSWHSYYPGLQLCVETGIPMMNPMLSRVSVSQALGALQVVSHPLISRKLFDQLPNRKPILLFKGIKADIHENEAWLLTQADTVAQTTEYVALAYHPWTRRDSSRWERRRAFAQNGIQQPPTVVFEHFDGKKTERSFYGEGARRVIGREQEVWTGSLPDPKPDAVYEASLWVYVDTEKFGLPFWKIEQYDQKGQLMDSQRVWTTRSRDTQHGWVRVAIPFVWKNDAVRLKLLAEYQFDCWMDEFLIREKTAEVFWDSGPNAVFFSYNNILISKE